MLSETESLHCTVVLRLGVGASVRITDGKGGLYNAIIEDASQHKRCRLRVAGVKFLEQRNGFLHIAIAPPKSTERVQWFVEKAVELGADSITPLLCEHSERKEVNCVHLEQKIIAATKQSESLFLPSLQHITPFREFVARPFEGAKCIAHCHKTADKVMLSEAIAGAANTLVLIGPEGDFSPAEVLLAQRYGFTEVSLGVRRLRVETAGIVAGVVARVARGEM
jgi:16S rRNA (uracil1498-N3)-methyltransferase